MIQKSAKTYKISLSKIYTSKFILYVHWPWIFQVFRSEFYSSGFNLVTAGTEFINILQSKPDFQILWS